ncbi:MAG: CDP-alcohol phosphatidyltransferase family protein [Myxococcales bacterium]
MNSLEQLPSEPKQESAAPAGSRPQSETPEGGPPPLPPFSSVLKSREVEDPVNLWLHRPLAYAFVAAVYRTPITPNQVTFLAMALGLTAAGCWIYGTPTSMVVGGILLWVSAIMDGADGILARAKKMSSAFGRALDGLADMVVGFSTSAAGLAHIVMHDRAYSPGILVILGIVGVVCTVFQLNLYDAYKELFLRATRVGGGGESHSAAEIAQANKVRDNKNLALHARISMDFYEDYLGKQERFTQRTNPWGSRLLMARWRVTDETAEVYRRHNRLPMALWISISLAPHSYLFAIAGMLDMLFPYILLRITLVNGIAALALLLQRRASRSTLEAYEASGAL